MGQSTAATAAAAGAPALAPGADVGADALVAPAEAVEPDVLIESAELDAGSPDLPPDVHETVSRAAAIAIAAVLIMGASMRTVCRRQRNKSRTVIVSSRPGPTPTAEIGAEIISSRAEM